MKNRYSFSFALLLFAIIGAGAASAQMVGDNIFLPGQFVEVGIAPNGSLGSTRGTPSGYNPYMGTSFSLWDPATSGYVTVSTALMMVYDAGHDGWTVGTPPFFGDYSMPGTPYEGWGIQINGTHSEAQFQYYESGYQYSGGSLTGTPTSYANPSGKLIGVWNGSASSGGLQITQTTELDTNASWVIMTVKLVNTSGSSMPNVYYERETDPDNDEARGGSFTTKNVIDYQNDYAHRVQVTAWGTHYTTQSLSLCTKDCRAVCYIQSGWPMPTSTSLASVWGGSGVTTSGTVTADAAIGLVWNLGSIGAGDSTMITYAYVFNGTYGLDSALSNPQLVTLGVAHDSTDTVTSCAFAGDTLYASIINATTGNWAGSTWTWAPATSLTATTGTSSGVIMSGITGVTTYTISGSDPAFGACDSMTFFLTVSPSSGPSPPIVRDTSYCKGAISVPLTAVGVGLMWYTVPTGGVGSAIAPTPSTATVGTFTWYVSQTIAGCLSTRVPIHVTIIPLPSIITGTTNVCVGLTTLLSDATAGGTWTSSATATATVGAGTGLVTGVKAGTATISYSVSSGCSVSVIVTVNPLPVAITGTTTVCSGSTTTLFDGVGGTWSSSNTAIAKVGTSSGIVTGVSPGTSLITYTLPTGCIITTTVTVNFTPTAILGTPAVCLGLTTVLSDTTSGGIWSSVDTTVAKIGSGTGVVTGIAATIVTISYTRSGCAATVTFTVNPLPSIIVGSPVVCVGQTTTLFDGGGGTWASSNTAVATIGSGTGIVTGKSAGTATVTYTLPTGCDTTTTVTVNPNPSAITGVTSVCVGNTTALTDAVAGGSWSSGNPSIASVGPSSGIVTGISGGVDTVTYTLGSGCFTSIAVTVTPLPGIITGVASVCIGTTTVLTDASAGGTWSSSNTGIATVGVSSGIVTGVSAGGAFVTYTLGTGCIAVLGITVHAPPVGISGITTVCTGATTTLTDATAGGTWSSSITTVATVPATPGIVTGVAVGTTTITYKVFTTGCIVTTTVTVSPAPGPISGIGSICVGATTSLSDGITGGSWTSSNTSVATVGFATGVVTGISTGTSTIVYSLGGSCKSTFVVTVTAGPPAIGGTASMCIGSTTTLTDATPGGAWSSSNTGIATVGTGTGLVTGISAGTATISYSLGVGCTVTKTVTVNPLPPAISGITVVCIGATTTLTDTTAGGLWSSSNTLVATAGSLTGIISGIAAGTATITYKLPTGCTTTITVTVNAATAITGTASMCQGLTTSLTDALAGGTWSSSNTDIATVGGTGIVSGVSFGIATITYTPPTGCAVTKTVTVNPLPGPITGASAVCVGATATLTDGGGGTWSSSNTIVASIGSSSGVVTGGALGTTTITYTLPTGCIITTVISVSSSPGVIGGPSVLCASSTITLSDGVTGGSWTSSNTDVATVIISSGVVSGVSAGTATITYSLGSGCTVTKTITVNPAPTGIGGTTTLCIGATSTLTDGVSGGTWSSSNTVVASVTGGGFLSGLTAGTATITYALSGGCIATVSVLVAPSPSVIGGTTTVCIGNTVNLSDAVGGGTWTSNNTSVATVGLTSGIVDGISAGTAVITYSLGSGCIVTTTVTVSAGPAAITGTATLCAGGTTLLSDVPGGGTWSSSNTSVATISGAGLVTGVAAGTATITYTLGCVTTMTVTVSPAPTAIGGPSAVCKGQTITLSDAVSGGAWTSSNTTVASVVSGSGVVTGLSSGTSTISYSLGALCVVTQTITVNSDAPITGGASICTGLTTTLTDGVPGGTWSSSNTSVAIVSGGIVTGEGVGTATISYLLPTGCLETKVVTVNSIPVAISGPLSVCKGSTVTLSDATTGGTWFTTSGNATVNITSGLVTGVLAGTATITYSLGSGCTVTAVVTVDPLPLAITGSSNVCIGSTITLSDVGGGTWSSASTNISVTLGGAVTGFAVPSAVVTYTLPTGCIATKTISIDALPPAITGPAIVCQGQTITLMDASAGTWTSSATTIATIGLGTGIVTGVASGVAKITFTIPTGCVTTANVTVIAAPGAISGPADICVGQTALLTDASTGGVWTSGDGSVASIGSGTGIVTGQASGTVLMSYTVGSGCVVFTPIIVNPISPITGSNIVCQGQTIALMDTTLGGTWSSSNTAIATVDPAGIVTGVSGGLAAIAYLMPTGCKETLVVTVLPAPKPITGLAAVCVGQLAALHDATAGGVWSSALPGIGSVDPTSGIVTGISAGTTPISYTAGGCPATVTLTVYPVPSPIGGPTEVCLGQSITLTDAGGGKWSSSNTAVAGIGLTSGIVNGLTTGTSTIIYVLPTGCTSSMVITVDPLPGAIAGPTDVCVNSTITLSDATIGGAWGSTSAHVSVNAGTGDVTGLTAGAATISYSLATGCASTILVTVNPLPAPILGAASVCVGQSTTLADAAPGGTWSSDNTTVATIGSGSGVANGIASGTANISYTLGTGCQSGLLFTVNPVPAPIVGNPNVCIATGTTLSESSTGGLWSSSNTAVATTDASGDITGIAVGTTTISYTYPSGCAADVILAVHPFPKPIAGPNDICLGATDKYTDAVSGGIWSSSNTSVATIDPASGLANGVALGAATISYTITVGCEVSTAVNVVPLPTKYTITGGGPFCAGGSGVGVGLSGSATGIDYFLYVGGAVATGPVAGTGSALSFGPQTVGGTYTVLAVNTTTGCSVVMLGTVSVIVNPSVRPSVSISVPGGDTVCSGALTNFTAVPVHGGLTPAYQWNINGTNVGLTGIYSYVPANGDVVVVTLTSSETCAVPAIVTDTVKMTVSAPQMPTATIMANPGDTVCQGFPVTLTASLEFGGTLPVITWVKNTVAAATGASFTYLPSNNDVIYCTVASNYPCVITGTVNSPVIKMTVDSPIIPHVVIVANPGANIKPNQLDTLTADVSNIGSGGATYQWLVNGFPVDTATGAIYINSFKDHDTVSCQVTSSGMCKMTTHNWIYLNVSTEGVQQVLQGVDGITVLPNPNKGEFIVKGSLGTNNDEEVTLELTDLLGQVVYHSKVTAHGGNVNEKVTLSKSLANGMYLLNLRSAVDTKVFHVVVEQ